VMAVVCSGKGCCPRSGVQFKCRNMCDDLLQDPTQHTKESTRSDRTRAPRVHHKGGELGILVGTQQKPSFCSQSLA
jgi:hypothetical protein